MSPLLVTLLAHSKTAQCIQAVAIFTLEAFTQLDCLTEVARGFIAILRLSSCKSETVVA